MALFRDTGTARVKLSATLCEAIAGQLRQAIISGDLAPDTLLKDSELAQQLGFSTTPVREALVQLAAEGLVEIQPNRLKRVTSMDFSAIVELLEVQNQLWLLGYVWGAPKVGPNELIRLRQVQAEHAKAIKNGDTAAVIAAAPEFHRVMVEIAGNRELSRVALDRMALIQRFVTLAAPELASAEAMIQHQNMLDALERGDADAAIVIYKRVSRALVEAAIALRDVNR